LQGGAQDVKQGADRAANKAGNAVGDVAALPSAQQAVDATARNVKGAANSVQDAAQEAVDKTGAALKDGARSIKVCLELVQTSLYYLRPGHLWRLCLPCCCPRDATFVC
jgi:hypothetical protein